MSTTLGPLGFTVDVDDGYLSEAADIERLGFTGLWINGGQLDSLDRLGDLIDATDSALVGSAIIPPDVFDADTVSAFYARIESTAPSRLLIGLGSPQRPRALHAVNDYLDRLDAASHPIPQERRLLAAFGPRALDLARERFAGAVPGLITPAYAAVARQRIGPDRTLAVGLLVVLDESADSARAAARVPLSFVTRLPPYVKSLTRQGFTEEDIFGLSDRLVDELVAWGRPDHVARRIHGMLAAGADHVVVSALGGSGQPTGLAAARLLASAIG
jgi:probable F420-dependent oxidoreductase